MAKKQRRALVPTGIVILAVLSGVNYFFAPADSASANGGGAGSGADVPLTRLPTPDAVVNRVYSTVGNDDQALCTVFFTKDAAQQFAKDLGASSCPEAVHKVATKIAPGAKDDYRNTTVPSQAIKLQGSTSAKIMSCKLGVQGGDPLGTFLLTRDSSGWIITGHQPDPADCATTN